MVHAFRVQLFPDPPLQPPPLLSGIRILQKSRRETFAAIARLERPPMPKYTLARECFDAVLKGQDWKWALKEAKASTAVEQSRHAVDILKLGKAYLAQRRGADVQKFAPASWKVNHELALPIRFDTRLNFSDRQLAIHYHFWRREMSEAQQRLVLRAMRDVLWALPGCNGMEFELVQAPWSEIYKSRRMRALSSQKCSLASDDEIENFRENFSREWKSYHDEHPTRRWNHNRQ
jgi:hypothetical protein